MRIENVNDNELDIFLNHGSSLNKDYNTNASVHHLSSKIRKIEVALILLMENMSKIYI